MSPAKRLVALSAFLLIWIGCNLGTPTGGGTGVDGLSGTLVSANGTPVAGAWVKVYSANDSTPTLAKGAAESAEGLAASAVVESVQTSANGSFLIPNLASGSYDIVSTTVRGDTTLSYFLQGVVFTNRLDLGTDTLRVSGTVTIDVRAMGAPLIGAVCFIPGSPFAGVSNADGLCTLTQLPPGRFDIVLTRAGYRIGVMGDLQVLSGILTQGGLLNLIGMGNPPASAPNQVSPLLVSTTTPVSGQLKWRKVASAMLYQVQLATDANFTTIILHDSLLTDTTKAYGPLAGGAPYYWRVRARNTVGFGPWSNRRKFTTVGTAPNVTAKLVAHWDFEEGSGTTLNDRTSEAHTGAITNGTWTTGIKGSGLSFDGTSSQVLVPFKSDLNLRQFTISAWFKTTRTNGQALVTRQTSSGGALPWNYRLVTTEAATYGSSVVPAAHGLIDYNPANASSIGTSFLADGEWHQLTGVLRDTVLELYVDGVLEQTSIPGILPDTTSTEPLRLGASAFTDGAHFQGTLDEIRIYNGPLTTIQIDSLYQAFKPIALTGDTTLIASQDAYIVGSAPGITSYIANANENYGKNQTMPVGVYDRNTVVRTLIQFQIPTGVTSGKISKAVLRLQSEAWVSKNVQPDSVKIRTHKVLRAWKEGNGKGGTPTTAAIDGVTALERFWGVQDGSEDWNQKLVGLDDVDASSAPAGSATRARGYLGYWGIDLTDLAKFWADSPSQNFGVIMEGDIAPTDQLVEDYPYFYAREYPGADSIKPSLILTVDP